MRFILLCFFIFQFTNAQNFNDAEVFFSNGKSLKGYGKIGFRRFVFKKDKDGPTIGYKHIGIDSIQIFRGDSITTYQFKRDKQEVYLMRVIESGEATLLKNTISGNTYSPQFGFQSVGGTTYYISKKGDLETTSIYTEGAVIDKSFRRTMAKVFKSCPSLIEKLENKEYKKSDVREVVGYFNKNCYF